MLKMALKNYHSLTQIKIFGVFSLYVLLFCYFVSRLVDHIPYYTLLHIINQKLISYIIIIIDIHLLRKMDDEQFDEKTMPNQFLCPISQQIMKDPVLTVDGFCFQRRQIQQWFNKGKNTNPVTNVPLNSTTLVPNRSLRNVIQHHNSRVRQIQRQAQSNAQKIIKQHNQRLSSIYPELVNQFGVLDLDKFAIFSSQAQNLRGLLKNSKELFVNLRKAADKDPGNCRECKIYADNLKIYRNFMDKNVQEALKLVPVFQPRVIVPDIVTYLIINSEIIKGIDFRRLKKDDLKKNQIKGIMLINISMEQLIAKIRKQSKIPQKDFIRLWITNYTIEQLYMHIIEQVQTITGSYLCKVKCVGKKVQNFKKKIHQYQLTADNYLIIEHGPNQEYVFRDQQAKCDYCYRVKKIQAYCDCKKVFYCSKECKVKDKPYHQNVCKLIHGSSNLIKL